LHQRLEKYPVPPTLVGTTNLRGKPVPRSIFPVFRDEDELPADADLSTPILRALDHSLGMVVICSPRARASASSTTRSGSTSAPRGANGSSD
jgi:hypothetical protein